MTTESTKRVKLALPKSFLICLQKLIIDINGEQYRPLSPIFIELLQNGIKCFNTQNIDISIPLDELYHTKCFNIVLPESLMLEAMEIARERFGLKPNRAGQMQGISRIIYVLAKLGLQVKNNEFVPSVKSSVPTPEQTIYFFENPDKVHIKNKIQKVDTLSLRGVRELAYLLGVKLRDDKGFLPKHILAERIKSVDIDEKKD